MENLFEQGFKIIPIEDGLARMKQGEAVLLMHPEDYKVFIENYNKKAEEKINQTPRKDE